MHASDCLGAFCHTYWDWREGWPFPSLLMFAAGCGALDSQSLSSVTRPYCARSSSLAVPACDCAARKGGEVCKPSVVALRFVCSRYPTATEPRTTVRSSKATAPVSPPSPSSPLQPPRTRGFRNRRGSADTTDDYDEAQCHSRGGNEIRVGSFARIPLLLALRLDTLTGGMQVHIKIIVAEEQTELSGADVGRSTVDQNVVAAPFSCYP